MSGGRRLVGCRFLDGTATEHIIANLTRVLFIIRCV